MDGAKASDSEVTSAAKWLPSGKVRRFDISSVMIPQYPGVSREVYFLDAFVLNSDGSETQKNVVNGDYDYCQRVLHEVFEKADWLKQPPKPRNPTNASH
jgi:hypothetical protein